MYILISVFVTFFLLSVILHLFVRKVAKKIPQDANQLFYQSDRIRVKNAVYDNSDFSLLLSDSDKIIIRTLVITRILIVSVYLAYLLF